MHSSRESQNEARAVLPPGALKMAGTEFAFAFLPSAAITALSKPKLPQTPPPQTPPPQAPQYSPQYSPQYHSRQVIEAFEGRSIAE